MARAGDGDLPLLHGLEQGGLGLGRRAIDLVGEDDVGEERAVQELEQPLAGGLVLLEHLGAGDVRRHQVRRELNAAEAEVERVGQRADHERLRQPRHADQQAVAAREDGDEQFLEHALLADHGLGQFLANTAIAVVQAFDGGEVAVDARPALRRLRGFSLHDNRDLVGGQPGAAAAKPPPAFRDLHRQATVLTLHCWHRNSLARNDETTVHDTLLDYRLQERRSWAKCKHCMEVPPRRCRSKAPR